jgi:ornithine carbamoyltransferase
MGTLQGRDLLSLADLSTAEIQELLDLAADMKSGKVKPRCDRILGLLFYKASTRTRVSFSAAMYQLGGQVIDLNVDVTQVSRGEPLADTARVLDRYLDVLAIRTFDHQDLHLFADRSEIPIINALTDLEHPCQILADLLTVKEVFGDLTGLKLTYLGDGNNVAHSLLLGCALMGMNITVATPKGYQPHPTVVEQAKAIAGSDRSEIIVTDDPKTAVKDAAVLYADVWASMGQENLADARIPIFEPYQIDDRLVDAAHRDAIVLHCLPAHRLIALLRAKDREFGNKLKIDCTLRKLCWLAFWEPIKSSK